MSIYGVSRVYPVQCVAVSYFPVWWGFLPEVGCPASSSMTRVVVKEPESNRCDGN